MRSGWTNRLGASRAKIREGTENSTKNRRLDTSSFAILEPTNIVKNFSQPVSFSLFISVANALGDVAFI